ncbi:MAG: hypothetical protein QOH21_646 [Acidobacteriota bacterium]|jgi:hypothetical protein|nr:hypothetical protein [Acidobacteriota bacterium]
MTVSDKDTLVLWRPVPAGSVLKASATGDETAFDVVIPWSRKGVDQIPFRHSDIVPGPQILVFQTNDQVALNPIVTLFRDVDQPLSLKIVIEDPDGNPVMVMAPEGPGAPKVAAACEWQISQAADSPLLLKILTSGV